MTRTEFSKNLVKCREEAQCGKNEMCRRANLTFNQLQRIENAANNFSVDNVLSYLKSIDCGLYICKNNSSDFLFNNRDMLSSKFKSYRKELKMSLRDFSIFTGVSLSVVRGIENGNKNTAIDSILLCIEKLDCKIEIRKLIL